MGVLETSKGSWLIDNRHFKYFPRQKSLIETPKGSWLSICTPQNSSKKKELINYIYMCRTWLQWAWNGNTPFWFCHTRIRWCPVQVWLGAPSGKNGIKWGGGLTLSHLFMFFTCQNNSEVPKHILQTWGNIWSIWTLNYVFFFGKIVKTGVAKEK